MIPLVSLDKGGDQSTVTSFTPGFRSTFLGGPRGANMEKRIKEFTSQRAWFDT